MADVFTDLTDGLAVRKILVGVQSRVGNRIESTAQTDAEFAVLVAVALAYAAALVLLILRAFSWRRWLVALGAGVVWLITWYVPASTWVRALLLVDLVYVLWQAHRSGRSRWTVC